MKKVVSMLVLVFVFTLTTQAQKRGKKDRKATFTVEQKATLAVKKMALSLDLTANQQNQMKSLIADKMNDRMAMKKKMMAMKESDKKPTADEKFAMANANLDKRLAYKNRAKQILNEEQFSKFEKMAKKKRMPKNGKRKGRRNAKERK